MFQRSFRSSLRMKDFKKARKVLKTILEEKKKFTLDRKSIDAAQAVVKTQGTELVDFYEENGDFLEAEEGKMLLTLAEVDFTYNSCVREMQKVKTIFGKYYLPHMQSKLDAMFRLREKLLVIGTLDSLMVLYLKLIKGIALPITTIAEARDFENGVLDHVKFLINGHFKDVGSIKEQAEGLVKEFRNNQSDFVELEELELEEVEVAEDPQEIGAN